MLEQALWAGFKQDPTDGNFYGTTGWQNEQLCRLQQLVCLDLAKILVNHVLNNPIMTVDDVEKIVSTWYQRYQIKH